MTSTENANAKESRSKVERWLREEFTEVREERLDGMAWSYRFRTPGGRYLLLSRPIAAPESLTIVSTVTVSAEHTGAFNDLPREARSKFLWDLTIELLRMGLNYEGLSDPPGKIGVYTRVFFDGMNRDLFTHRVYSVDTAIMLIIALLRRLIGEPFHLDISQDKIH
jgi:hypothetical protein